MHNHLLRSISALALPCLVACGPSTAPSASPTGPGPGGATLLTIENDAPTNESSCEDRLDFARKAIDTVVDRANGQCSKDADCTLEFAETECQGACQAAILTANVDAFGRAQEAINDRVCTNYPADGCSYATPSCLEVKAVCKANKCAMEPAG